jgi:hypothetical protein
MILRFSLGYRQIGLTLALPEWFTALACPTDFSSVLNVDPSGR